MGNRKKICVITGTRAEYGLLFWTIKAIQEETCLQLQLVATGMHMSTEFGNTYKQIEKDGFNIDKKVEILLSSDSTIGISKSMGLAMISFSEVYDDLKPDCILVLGDRFEIFSAVASAMISRIPVVHCHGGEATEGLIDEAIRHSITKMAQLHFTSTEEYRKRVIQLGEQPEKVFNVGALGIENINKLSLLSKNKFEESIGFSLKKRNVLVTFHPVTLEYSTAKEQMQNLLDGLNEYDKNMGIIFTKANADTDGRVINEMIDQYVKDNSENSVAHTSLGQLRYLSALKYVDAIVGNSSSGLIEVPSFRKPTINIGMRQHGRIKAESVIDCDPKKQSIIGAIKKALSDEFQELLKNVENPYGKNNASEQIVAILRKSNFKNLIVKSFYNIDFKCE